MNLNSETAELPANTDVLRRGESEFIELWLSGKSDENAHDQLSNLLKRHGTPLYGRIIHGHNQFNDDVVKLSADKWKRLSWVFGSDALYHFLGKSGYEICLLLGFGKDWLNVKINQETNFKLVIFSEANIEMCQPATWDGIFSLLENHYPEVWPLFTDEIQLSLKTMSFDEIEKLAGYCMKDVNIIGRNPITGVCSDPRYVSLKKLQEIVEDEDDRPMLVVLRQFLFDELGVKELFTGIGRTASHNKALPTCKEYLALNKPLVDIQGHRVIELDLKLP